MASGVARSRRKLCLKRMDISPGALSARLSRRTFARWTWPAQAWSSTKDLVTGHNKAIGLAKFCNIIALGRDAKGDTPATTAAAPATTTVATAPAFTAKTGTPGRVDGDTAGSPKTAEASMATVAALAACTALAQVQNVSNDVRRRAVRSAVADKNGKGATASAAS